MDELIKSSGPAGLDREDLKELRPGDQEAFQELRENIRKVTQEIGVCSFSAVPDHILMWSHYANHHRGFCIEYDNSEGTQLRKLCRKVRYEDSVPSLTTADLSGGKREEFTDALWLTKASCWSYEQEWRIMMSSGDKSYQAPAPVLSIIFGARMPESDRVMIARALRHEPSINFKEAVIEDGAFRISINDA